MKSFCHLLFSAFLLIQTTFISAQNYRVLQPERTTMFRSENGNILGMRVDSVRNDGNDTVFYLLKNLQQVDYECYHLDGPSWMGDRITIKPNGETIFYNLNMEEILIKTLAVPGESWVCYSTPSLLFTAKVDSIRLSDFLGLTDSVRYISFQAQNGDGQNISHYINAKRIAISKNYGLTRTLNFFNFPDIEFGFVLYSVQEMNLIGFNNPQTGVQNLTWKKVHDHSIGDELHCISENGSMNSQSETDEIMLLLDKSVVGDTVFNVWERKIKRMVYESGNQSFTASIDTVTRVITSKPEFDKLPGVAYDMNILRFGDYSTHSMYQSEIALIKDDNDLGYFVQGWSGNCYVSGIFDGCSPPYIYYEGLGGPYYYCTFFGFDYTKRRLVYYRKDGEEWGTPIDFTVNTNQLPVEAKPEFIKVFPNPSVGTVNIEFKGNTGEYILRITDTSGRQAGIFFLKGESNSIDLSNLTRGIYQLEFITDHQTLTRKLSKW